jgi:hypothetical protein
VAGRHRDIADTQGPNLGQNTGESQSTSSHLRLTNGNMHFIAFSGNRFLSASAEEQVAKRRILMFSYTTEKRFDRLASELGGAIDDKGFVIDHGKPSIGCNQSYGQY